MFVSCDYLIDKYMLNTYLLWDMWDINPHYDKVDNCKANKYTNTSENIKKKNLKL